MWTRGCCSVASCPQGNSGRESFSRRAPNWPADSAFGGFDLPVLLAVGVHQPEPFFALPVEDLRPHRPRNRVAHHEWRFEIVRAAPCTKATIRSRDPAPCFSAKVTCVPSGPRSFRDSDPSLPESGKSPAIAASRGSRPAATGRRNSRTTGYRGQSDRSRIDILRVRQLSGRRGLEIHAKNLGGAVAVAGEEQGTAVLRDRPVIIGRQQAGVTGSVNR